MQWNEAQEEIRQRVREKRGAQTEIARQHAISQPSVAQYITGGKTIPLDHLDTILDVLDLELELVKQQES